MSHLVSNGLRNQHSLFWCPREQIRKAVFTRVTEAKYNHLNPKRMIWCAPIKSDSKKKGTYLVSVLWPFRYFPTDYFSQSSLLFTFWCLMCIQVHRQGAAKSLLQEKSFLNWIPASLRPSHSQPLRDDWRGVGDKVSRIFRILSGLGIWGHRVYTCQQRCQPSSACRKIQYDRRMA